MTVHPTPGMTRSCLVYSVASFMQDCVTHYVMLMTHSDAGLYLSSRLPC